MRELVHRDASTASGLQASSQSLPHTALMQLCLQSSTGSDPSTQSSLQLQFKLGCLKAGRTAWLQLVTREGMECAFQAEALQRGNLSFCWKLVLQLLKHLRSAAEAVLRTANTGFWSYKGPAVVSQGFECGFADVGHQWSSIPGSFNIQVLAGFLASADYADTLGMLAGLDLVQMNNAERTYQHIVALHGSTIAAAEVLLASAPIC